MTPPRLAERLLTRRLRGDVWGDTTLGDLREEFADLAARRGRGTAVRWYWRETFRLLLPSATSAHAEPHARKDPLMLTFLHETRLAARSLIRKPLLSLVIIATMAIGLGANAATFGMVDALLLRPFTVPNVDRLVIVSEASPELPFPQESVSPANYLDLTRDLTGAVRRLSTVSWWDVNLSGTDQAERIQGSRVGADFFTMLGVAPADGRMFVAADEVEGAARTVVISDTLWHRRFAASPTAIGSTLRLDGETYTIVGRAPAGFEFPNGSQLWAPHVFSAEDRADRTARYLTVIGELAPGATRDQAQTEMSARYTQIRAEHEAENRNFTLVIHTFERGMVDYGMPIVLGLWQVAALLLLLIAGTNVANLLLTRGADRQRELAVRLAIGAGRWHVIRQLLIESCVLALAAIPAALLVASAAISLVRSLLPAELVRFLPGWTAMGVTPRVVIATALAAVATSVLFGLWPALRASNIPLSASLKDGGRSSTSGIGRSRLRRGLVVAEIALAIPLLLAASMAALGAHRMAAGPQGYEPDGLVRVRLSLAEAQYPDADTRRLFTSQLLDEVQRDPTVREVATTTVGPASSTNMRRQLVVDGEPPDLNEPRWINYRAVSAGFHDVLGIPIVSGRGLTAQDRDRTERVAVISESLAQLYWPDASPIGRQVKLSPTDSDLFTIVGVSGNVLDDGFISRNAPTVYVPVTQRPSSQIHLLARGAGDDAALLAAIRGAIARVDPTQPAFDAQSMPQAIYIRTSGLRFVGQLMAAFGLLALVLAAAGIYSVMANYVAQRRHEIGVRMALGASHRDVLRLTVVQGMKLAAIGIGIGLALGGATGHWMESALFGAATLDAPVLIGVPLVLACVAAIATLVPARAAVRVDPAGALRD